MSAVEKKACYFAPVLQSLDSTVRREYFGDIFYFLNRRPYATQVKTTSSARPACLFVCVHVSPLCCCHGVPPALSEAVCRKWLSDSRGRTLCAAEIKCRLLCDAGLHLGKVMIPPLVTSFHFLHEGNNEVFMGGEANTVTEYTIRCRSCRGSSQSGCRAPLFLFVSSRLEEIMILSAV